MLSRLFSKGQALVFAFPPRGLRPVARCSVLCLALGMTSAWAQGVMPSASSASSLPLAAAPALASEQGPSTSFTLAQLVDLVLAHNPELRAQQQSRVTAAAGVVTAGAWVNPTLEWEQGRNRQRLASGTPGTVQGWALALPLENPGLRSARVDAARAGERASIHQVNLARNALVAQVKLAAYALVLRQAEAQAAADALGLLEQVQERVRVRVRSGEAPRYEIIKADAEIINARQQAQSALLLAEQARLSLNRLAAGELPAHFDLALSLDDAFDAQALRDVDFIDHPELRQLQSELERAQAQLDAARASRWPGVELRYGQTREPDIRQNMLGVSVQIPLLDRKRGPVDEAASELERARLRLTGRQIELQQQLQLAWKSLEMASVRTKALSEGAVHEAEAALRVAEAAYRYGERGILDVLDAQRVLRSVRSDLLQARYQLQAARAELEFLRGTSPHAPQTPQTPQARQARQALAR